VEVHHLQVKVMLAETALAAVLAALHLQEQVVAVLAALEQMQQQQPQATVGLDYLLVIVDLP
jgi:hypothetical protein